MEVTIVTFRLDSNSQNTEVPNIHRDTILNSLTDVIYVKNQHLKDRLRLRNPFLVRLLNITLSASGTLSIVVRLD